MDAWLHKKAGNTFKKLPFHVGPLQFCEFLKKTAFYDALLESSDIPRKGDCPWPQRKYTVRGFRVPTEKIPPVFDGDYMFELRMLQSGKVLNGYRAYVTIISIGLKN